MSTKSRVGVTVKNGNVEKAISIFNKVVDQSGVLYKFRENQEYTKPSKRRREKRKKAIYDQRNYDRKHTFQDLNFRKK